MLQSVHCSRWFQRVCDLISDLVSHTFFGDILGVFDRRGNFTWKNNTLTHRYHGVMSLTVKTCVRLFHG